MLSTVKSMNTAIVLTIWEDPCIYAAPRSCAEKTSAYGGALRQLTPHTC